VLKYGNCRVLKFRKKSLTITFLEDTITFLEGKAPLTITFLEDTITFLEGKAHHN